MSLRNFFRIPRRTVVVENTGESVTDGNSNAVSGISGRIPKGSTVVVKNTGKATATGDGDAVSGVSYT